MIKSVERIDKMIEEGRIDRIYIVDSWDIIFYKKIVELFGNKVDVYRIKKGDIDGISLTEKDCVLLYETIYKSFYSNDSNDIGRLLFEAEKRGTFVKILTEDIFEVNIERELEDNSSNNLTVEFKFNKDGFIKDATKAKEEYEDKLWECLRNNISMGK
ncbi:MAG: hypothetical protein FH753_00940 [Firmicutes bacterium]|nr:hypothetical protein [Bacillota bacterium]